jgi:hypothetical protein
VQLPSVDYSADRFDKRPIDFGAADVLVAEGTYVFGLSGLDVRVFLEATYEDTRRAARATSTRPSSRACSRIEHTAVAAGPRRCTDRPGLRGTAALDVSRISTSRATSPAVATTRTMC